jgi:hypothetical protein
MEVRGKIHILAVFFFRGKCHIARLLRRRMDIRNSDEENIPAFASCPA